MRLWGTLFHNVTWNTNAVYHKLFAITTERTQDKNCTNCVTRIVIECDNKRRHPLNFLLKECFCLCFAERRDEVNILKVLFVDQNNIFTLFKECVGFDAELHSMHRHTQKERERYRKRERGHCPIKTRLICRNANILIVYSSRKLSLNLEAIIGISHDLLFKSKYT